MKKRRIIMLALAVLCLALFHPLCTVPDAKAQQQPSPEQMKAYMEVMMKTVLEVYSSPEMATRLAKFYRNLYEALMQAGFTKEEALQIVTSQGNILGGGQR